jgi:hypothetical protein
MVVALKLILSTISYKYYSETCKRKIFKIGCCCIKILRKSIPEYQAIADHVRQALDEVYYGIKEPKQALDDAAAKSAKVLGWL